MLLSGLHKIPSFKDVNTFLNTSDYFTFHRFGPILHSEKFLQMCPFSQFSTKIAVQAEGDTQKTVLNIHEVI